MKLMGMLTLVLSAIFPVAHGSFLVAQDSPPDTRRAMRRMTLYAEYPMTGTYKLNVARSRFDPGPALKSGTVRIEASDNSLKCVLDPVDSKGTARHGEWTAKHDGKDYPADMRPFADSIVLTKMSADAFVAVYKKASKVVLGEVLIFSEDRKILTVIQTEITTTGPGAHNTLVYEKR